MKLLITFKAPLINMFILSPNSYTAQSRIFSTGEKIIVGSMNSQLNALRKQKQIQVRKAMTSEVQKYPEFTPLPDNYQVPEKGE